MPITQISQQLNSVIMASAGASRIFALMDEGLEADDGLVTLAHVQEVDGELIESEVPTGKWAWRHPRGDGAVQYVPLVGNIIFDDVDFGYHENKQILYTVSYTHLSFTDKQFCAQDAFVFDVGTIQSGFTISEDYQSVIVGHAGTYVVQFGCLLASQPCEGDAVALELNSSMIIEESRLPMLCEGSFVQGSCIVELGEGDSLRMVSDTSQGVNVCSFNNTVNAYLIVYQIN